MSIELLVEPEDLSEEDLCEIFKLFCKTYDIKYSEKDEEFIKNRGIKNLMNNSGIDYLLNGDITFFGQITGPCITLSFYPSDKEKDEQIKKLVQEYLLNRSRK